MSTDDSTPEPATTDPDAADVPPRMWYPPPDTAAAPEWRGHVPPGYGVMATPPAAPQAPEPPAAAPPPWRRPLLAAGIFTGLVVTTLGLVQLAPHSDPAPSPTPKAGVTPVPRPRYTPLPSLSGGLHTLHVTLVISGPCATAGGQLANTDVTVTDRQQVVVGSAPLDPGTQSTSGPPRCTFRAEVLDIPDEDGYQVNAGGYTSPVFSHAVMVSKNWQVEIDH